MEPETNLVYCGDNFQVQWKKPAYLVSIVAALFILALLAGCSTSPSVSPKPSVATTTPAPKPTIPVLEVGQGAQFPGLIVTLRRVIWDGDTLSTYWVFSNNGNQKIGGGLIFPVALEATDSAGNEGEWTWSYPKWDEQEKTLPSLPSLTSEALWPGQIAVDCKSWKFGPLSKGIRVTATYTEFVGGQIKQSQAMWNIGR